MDYEDVIRDAARAIATADAKDGALPLLLENESYMRMAHDLARAAAPILMGYGARLIAPWRGE